MKRILIKVSGESISGKDSIIDPKKMEEVVKQVAELSKKYSVAIVLGGGNIWRGAKISGFKMKRTISDNMGMIATIMNAVAFAEALRAKSIETNIFSPMNCGNLTNKINYQLIDKYLSKTKSVIIFAGGTGNPYFTTDTGAALRASEIGAEWIIMGKNGVDGIYTDDPNKNPKAKLLENLSYNEVLDKRLKVMDLTALTICMENKIKIKVFNANKKNGFIDAINNKIKMTVVK